MTLEYFKRDPENWGIISFLKSCSEEPFERMIDKYLKQLETIVVNGRRCESEKAQLLINKYRKDPKPDFKKARKWNKERLLQIHIDKATINKIKSKFNYGNISVGPILAEQAKETRSKKRGYEEIDQLDFTTSNVITTTKNIENVDVRNSIIDKKQSKAYDLEKSWEFEKPIPEWLKRIHKRREDLATTVDTTDLVSFSRVAET
ncbi:hypothetical protein F8M41_008747 [Gigaspora margarita]|nr:hypothetical protein F8M41_008747 [Gigaspora margarita]